MQFLFSTGSLWSYSIERCFAFAAQAGFDGMEIIVDQRWDTRQPAYLHTLMARYRLPIVVVHSPFFPSVPGWPDDEPGRIQASLQLAVEVGAKRVVHHLPFRLGWVRVQAGARGITLPLPGWRWDAGYVRWLEQDYPAIQARTDVTLCIENMPARRLLGRRWQAHHWNSPAEIVRFPNLTLDTTHLGTWGMEPAEVLPQLNGRVRHVHLSNFNGKEHRRPEDGHLHLDRLLARLAGSPYIGAITLEMCPEALDAGQPDDHVAALLTTSLGLCRQWAGSGSNPPATPGANPINRVR